MSRTAEHGMTKRFATLDRDYLTRRIGEEERWAAAALDDAAQHETEAAALRQQAAQSRRNIEAMTAKLRKLG